VKNKKYTVPKFKTEKVLRFLINGFFRSYDDYRFYRIFGVRHSGGRGGKSQTPQERHQ
jgi:hypothetical protein